LSAGLKVDVAFATNRLKFQKPGTKGKKGEKGLFKIREEIRKEQGREHRAHCKSGEETKGGKLSGGVKISSRVQGGAGESDSAERRFKF